jgi:hypothetical protein
MALLTTINGIPLYSTVNEALAYAEAEGLQGYHTHRYRNIVGYMGGVTHEKSRQSSGSLLTQQQQQITAQQQLPQSLQTTSSYTTTTTTTTTTSAPSPPSGGASEGGGGDMSRSGREGGGY